MIAAEEHHVGRLEFFLNLHNPLRGLDRRLHHRLNSYWVKCDLGHVLDISNDGLRIIAKKPLKGIRHVRLWDERSGVIHQAEVKWCKRMRFRQYEVGLQFIDFGPELRGLLADIAARMRASV